MKHTTSPLSLIVGLALSALALAACTDSAPPDEPSSPPAGNQSSDPATTEDDPLAEILAAARRVPNSSGWFEVLHLPNDVYAFWEPGHFEKVNAFLILGSERDVLYDTGMGIASIGDTLAEVRRVEGLPDHELMVINSHNHLDHNGGNRDFYEIWTVDDPWARRRLELGVAPGEAGGFVAYWSGLTPHPGVSPPASFAAEAHGIPPYPLEQVRYLEDGEVLDLGNRQFRVIRTYSHTPDGIVLYDEADGLFFGGDAFYGADYLVLDMGLLATDLEMSSKLKVKWHYASHGPQLLQTMQHGRHLAVVRRMQNGEGERGITNFTGIELPMHELDGVRVTLARDLLLY